jgi:tRNA modification GTPase
MAFSTQDTIVAIATPPGRGGIGVVRLSGPSALPIAQQLITFRGALEPRRATFSRLRSKDACASVDAANPSDAIDHVVVISFPAPASYTGEGVVELSAHGSPVVLRAIVESAIACGARLAEPGEFTLRAFLNGRIDLMQAEAVADLIDAVTPLQARVAFDQLEGTLTRAIAEIDAALFDLVAKLEASIDFPDEGYHFIEPCALARSLGALIARTSALLSAARRGRLIRDGLQVAIVGEPNVGKSSLFNALVGAPRAIVTERPGTTRDLVTEVVDIDGLRVTLVDTAGLRDEATDPAEVEGIDRSRQAVAIADLVLQVVDDESPVEGGDERHLVVRNKSDLAASGAKRDRIYVSAKTGAGLDDLRRWIARSLDADERRDRPDISNVRHVSLVQRAHEALIRAHDASRQEGGSLPEEFVLADLQVARASLEEISGKRAPEDLLQHIFARFCVGK